MGTSAKTQHGSRKQEVRPDEDLRSNANLEPTNNISKGQAKNDPNSRAVTSSSKATPIEGDGASRQNPQLSIQPDAAKPSSQQSPEACSNTDLGATDNSSKTQTKDPPNSQAGTSSSMAVPIHMDGAATQSSQRRKPSRTSNPSSQQSSNQREGMPNPADSHKNHSSRTSNSLPTQKKQAYFSNHVIMHTVDPDNAIDSDSKSEGDYIDESAIDDENNSGWEDSIENSGKSSVDDKNFSSEATPIKGDGAALQNPQLSIKRDATHPSNQKIPEACKSNPASKPEIVTQPPAPNTQKKQASFSNHVIMHTVDTDNAIESDSEGDYIDESAIDDEDDSSDWEDSIEDSGKSSVDDKYFQRVDSKVNLTSRRSLITLMLTQTEDRAKALSNHASQSTSAIPQSCNRNGPAFAVSPNDSDDAPLMMKGNPQAPLKPIREIPRSSAQPIPTVAHGQGQGALSPRATRRNMLATELTESLRRHLLWERSQKFSTANAVLKRRHTSHDVAYLKQFPEKSCMKKTEDVNASSWNQYFVKETFDGYHSKGW